MANLSNVSPWIGAGQGLTAGIQSAGVIQGLMQQKTASEREERLAPMREEALNLELAGKRREEAFATSVWDPTKEDVVQYMSPPERESHLKAITDLTGGRTPTQADKKRYIEEVLPFNSKLFKSAAEKTVIPLKMQLQEAYKNYTINPTPENKAIYDSSYTAIKAAEGDIDTLHSGVQVNEFAKNNKELLDKSPALKMAVDWVQDNPKDASHIMDILKVIADNESKGATVTNAAGAHILGLQQEAQITGKPIDWKKAASDIANLKEPVSKLLTPAEEVQQVRIAGAKAAVTEKKKAERVPTTADISQLGEMVAMLNETDEPNLNDIELAKTAADKIGYKLEKLTGKSAAYGLPFVDKPLWGGNETTEWRLVPKQGVVSGAVTNQKKPPAGVNVSTHRANASAQIKKLTNPAAIQAVKDMYKQQTGQDY